MFKIREQGLEFGITYLLQLLHDARVEVLVHVLVSQGILRGLLRGGDGGIQVLQLFRKPHAHLEWIRHFY